MHIIRFLDTHYQPASHEDPQDPGVLKKVLLKRNELAEGNIQMINWALLPVGKAFAPHYHEDMEEVFIILSGEVVITLNQETGKLTKGDAIVIPAKTVHQMENTGNGDVEYIALGISLMGQGRTVNV